MGKPRRISAIAFLTALVACIWVLWNVSSENAGADAGPDEAKQATNDSTTSFGARHSSTPEAEAALDELARVSAEPISQPTDTSGWSPADNVERTDSYNPSEIRRTGVIPFRSRILNPEDEYIPPKDREALSVAFGEAIRQLQQLKSLQFSLANQQMAALAASGELVRTSGSTGPLRLPRDADAEFGAGWHSYSRSDGAVIEMRWRDLTWTKETSDLIEFMESQIDPMIIEFFATRGLMDSQRRDLLIGYTGRDGRKRLRALAAKDKPAYRLIRQRLKALAK